MKILKNFGGGIFDFALFGLGFESRAVSAFDKYKEDCSKILAIGYDVHTDKFSYKQNKKIYSDSGAKLFEFGDESVIEKVGKFLSNEKNDSPIKVLLDITVMSRHRLACFICYLMDLLPEESTLSIVYSLSQYIPPPEGDTPIRRVCEISSQLGGSLGDLTLPTSVVFGLGYEKSKALGVSNYLDPGFVYTFIPKSPIPKFEDDVIKNNDDLLNLVSRDNIFYYDVCSPYSTYLSLKSLIQSLKKVSRPLLVPLGPKILAALSVFLGKEMHPYLPIWRVSSEHEEIPVDRPASGVEVKFTIQL